MHYATISYVALQYIISHYRTLHNAAIQRVSLPPTLRCISLVANSQCILCVHMHRCTHLNKRGGRATDCITNSFLTIRIHGLQAYIMTLFFTLFLRRLGGALLKSRLTMRLHAWTLCGMCAASQRRRQSASSSNHAAVSAINKTNVSATKYDLAA